MNFNLSFMLEAFPTLLSYLPMTLFLAITSMVIASVMGMVLALIIRNRIVVLTQLAEIYISFFRSVPTLVTLFIFYFGIPQLFPGISMMNAISATIIALSFKTAANLAEEFRGAMNSVDKGQLEACLSVGLSRWQGFRRIVLPQTVRIAVPGMSNYLIMLIKESSLAFTVGVTDIFAQTKILASNSFRFLESYLAVALIYWAVTILLTLLQKRIEHRLNRPYREGVSAMLKISHLHKSFSDNPVLKDISLEIAQGQVVAIIGPSGSGKSTLLRCINLLEKPESGTLDIAGTVVDAKKFTRQQETALRAHTGMVFQHYNLFKNKTALENITEALIVGKKIPKAQANETGMALLERVGLREKADSYPAMLSGGQQQRVAIARALAVKPKVILFDEPTSALDPELVNEVLQVIRSIVDHETTLILVTHEMSFAKDVADRVIFMADGVIVEDNTAEQLFTQPQHERTRKFLQSTR